MSKFKEWWGKQEFFGGEGCMDAAELSWDKSEGEINELKSDISRL